MWCRYKVIKKEPERKFALWFCFILFPEDLGGDDGFAGGFLGSPDVLAYLNLGGNGSTVGQKLR